MTLRSLFRSPSVSLPVLGLLAACAVGCGPASTTDVSTEAVAVTEPHVAAADPVAAGRYLVVLGGCNDCHTPRYAEIGDGVPESEWLTGSPVGFRGPWGTSYPSNLRLLVQDQTEDAFVQMLHTRTALPPMPWVNVNKLAEQDARAIYRFIRSLGPAGERMPPAAPPDQEPATPYIDFVPQHLERLQMPPATPES